MKKFKKKKNINNSLNILIFRKNLYPKNYRHSPIQTKSIKNKKEIVFMNLYILYE